MKKILSNIFAIGAAVMLIPSCSVENPAGNSGNAEGKFVTLHLTSQGVDTKGYFKLDGNSAPAYFSGEEGDIYVNLNMAEDSKKNNVVKAENVSYDGTSVSFDVTLKKDDESSSYTIYAILPGNAYSGYTDATEGIEMVIPASQTPSPGKLDDLAMPLIGWNDEVITDLDNVGDVSIKFHHVAAYMCMNLTGISLDDGDELSSLEIYLPDDAEDHLTGTVYYNKSGVNGFYQEKDGSYKCGQKITVDLSNFEVDDDGVVENLWVGCYELQGGANISFSLKTTKGKSYTVANAIAVGGEEEEDLKAGDIAKFKVSFEDAKKSAVTDDGTKGTEDDPYTVNKVNYLYDTNSNDEDAYVYVKGIISEIDEVSTSYGNATYYISDDGTTTDQYEIFRGYYLGNVKFTSEDQIKVGDEVVIYGKLITYNKTTREMKQGNYIVSINGIKHPGLVFSSTSVSATLGEEFDEPILTNKYNLSVIYTSSNTEVATVNQSTGEVTIISAGTTTITASFAGDDNYVEDSASYTLTVVDPTSDEDLVLTFDFSSLSEDTGTKSWPTSASSTGGSYTYTLDGTTYTFDLSGYVYTGSYNGNYLMLGAKKGTTDVSLGLPAIAGYKLSTVVLTTGSNASESVYAGISSTSATTFTEVSGGSYIQLNSKGGEFTYSLSGTSANMMYYIYVPYNTSKSYKYNAQITKLVLTYTK